MQKKFTNKQIFLLIFICSVIFFCRAAICFLCVDLFWGLSYNPLTTAPKSISSKLLQKINSEKETCKHEGRVLFVSTLGEGNLYAAAGGKILNGFFAYEDTEIFDLLLKKLPNSRRFHRLNHMIVKITPAHASLFSAEIPQKDVINLKFNGPRYHFPTLPADYILVRDPVMISLLDRNKTLKPVDKFGTWKRYRILHEP